jgi:predicted PurR-regulated permease PerM
MDSDFYRKAFFVALALLLSFALARILVPFSGALSWGLCLAFLLSPVQRSLTRHFRGRANLAAGLLTGLTPVVVLLPLASLGLVFAQQVRLSSIRWSHARWRCYTPTPLLARRTSRPGWSMPRNRCCSRWLQPAATWC